MHRYKVPLALLILLAVLGCCFGSLLPQALTPMATPARTLKPTFAATPTASPTPTATDTPTPTETPTNTPIPTPTPTCPPTATGLLQVTFLDVNQGDTAWLKTFDGWDILIDGGKRDEGQGLVSYLQSHGVTDIEVLVLTHPHDDHVGGLIAILEKMEVDQALTNCQSFDYATYREFQELLLDKGIPTACVRDGDNFTWGGVSANAVNPPEPLLSDANNNSVVLRISYGTIDLLFTGDIESEAEAEILGRGRTVEAEILKVAHHGSGSSSIALFLAQVDPEIAVISVGASNPYGHPDPETLARLYEAGATIYRTDLQGTIVVTTDGTTYSVRR